MGRKWGGSENNWGRGHYLLSEKKELNKKESSVKNQEILMKQTKNYKKSALERSFSLD